jgi:hypothetical protein
MSANPDRTLRVADWGRLYENNRTRELKRMDWVPIPNRMDGDGYTELVDHPAGAAHLGAWLAILQIASRCDPRGTLLRDASKPHTPQSLARISRLPAAVFEEAVSRLLDIGWLELEAPNLCATNTMHDGAEIPQATAVIPQADASPLRGSDYGMEGNGREGNTHTTALCVTPRAADLDGTPSQQFDELWQRWPRKEQRDRAARDWLSFVTTENEASVMACGGRYLASDEVARGVVKNFFRWLEEQHRDGWAGDWPVERKAPAAERKPQKFLKADPWGEDAG